MVARPAGYRIVLRLLPDEDRPRQIQIVSIGPRANLDAYRRAAARLDRWMGLRSSAMEALAFQAVLVPYAPSVDWPADPVVRTIAVREDQTLEQLHEALRIAFGWADAHMYCFWMSGKWWDSESVRYQTPFELDPSDEDTRSGRVALADLSLRKGKTIAYLFDFGDEWRVLLKVVDRWEAGDETYPQIVEASGTPPPQYAPLDDDEDGED